MKNSNEKSFATTAIQSIDKGYYESNNIKFLADKRIDGYIPRQEKKIKNPYDKKNFSYVKQKDESVCPEKKSLIFFKDHYDKPKNKIVRKYRGGIVEMALNRKIALKQKKEYVL
jgi:hypothetical protein